MKEEDYDDEPDAEIADQMIPEDLLPEESKAPKHEDAPAPPEFEIPEEEANRPFDFTPYLEQLAPSTREILEREYHANFIHLIQPRSEKDNPPSGNKNEIADQNSV